MSLKPPQSPNTPLGTSGASGLPTGWKTLKGDWGATGDGTADDSTPIQNAVNYITTNGGTLVVEPGDYKHNSSIVINDTAKPWRITGSGGWHHQSVAHTTFTYTGGAGAAPGWDVQSTFSFEIDHLRFRHSNAAFNGFQMDVDWGSPALDPQVFSIHDCGFNAQVASSAAVGLRLNHAIIGRVSQCHFGRFGHGIRISEAGGTYGVGLYIEGNTFNFYQDAAIAIGGADIESVTIRYNVFEDPVGDSAILGLAGNACYNLAIENNWFGDATTAPADWITGLASASNNQPCVISGNKFGDSANGTHLGTLTGFWIVQGNSFDGDALFTSAPSRLVIRDNLFNDMSSLWPTQPTRLTASGNHPVGTSKRVIDTAKQLVVGGMDESSPTIEAAAPTDGESQGALVLGQMNGSGGPVAPTTTTRAAIYTSGSGPGAQHLYLQAAADHATAREVRIAAGTTPASKLRANGDGIAFNGQAPAARPDYTVTNHVTDRAYDANATTTDELADVLGTLIADLIAIGLLQ